jgi:tRNA threonylcarbamoyladenosine biosynthesis protein TsaE
VSAPLVLHSRSATETERFGEALGRALRSGDFIGLTGDLGSGKTVPARGIARGAGVPPEALVSSPTFAIVNAYSGGRLPVFHADLYRVKDAEELYDAGFYDLENGGGALVVEWFDRVPEVAPSDWLEIRLTRDAVGRSLKARPHVTAVEHLVMALRAEPHH